MVVVACPTTWHFGADRNPISRGLSAGNLRNSNIIFLSLSLSIEYTMASHGGVASPLLPWTDTPSRNVLRNNARLPIAFFGSRRPFRSCKVHSLYRSRSACIVRNGLFDFLAPGQSSGASKQLVSEIFEAARGTNGGSRATSETREEIEELVRTVCSAHYACMHMWHGRS